MSQSERLTVHHLDHFVLTVADMDLTIAFYCDVLGMRHEVFTTPDGAQRHAVYFGASKINLHPQTAPFDPKAAHPTPGSADLCFLTHIPLAAWQAHLAENDTPVTEGPVARTGATGPLQSLYLRDPDGNLIEISVSDQPA